MSLKKYHRAEVQICGECLGEGKVWKQTEPTRNVSSDFEMGTYTKCSICNGSGMVRVTRNVTIKIEPYTPKDK